MTVEQIEIRRVISQMLADQGINQTTLKNVVKDMIDEKVNKSIRQALAEMDIDRKISDYFSNGQLKRDIINAIKEKANGLINHLNVYVSIPDDSMKN